MKTLNKILSGRFLTLHSQDSVGVLVGADPEFFVSIGGDLVSAHGMVEGTKSNPLPVPCGAVQVDGMALEFNIDPASTKEEFTTNIKTVLQGLRELVPDEVGFEFQPVATFGEEYIRNQPEKAKELGCEPDYNSYTGAVNPTPDANGDFRTAAGHIHIGMPKTLDDVEKRKLVILCDLVLGLQSLFYDTDSKRRELYGRAGCYRSKEYGIEYRTLSNAWLCSEELQEWVYDSTLVATTLLGEFKEVFKFIYDKTGVYYTQIEHIINNSHSSLAGKVLEALEGYLNVRIN